MCTAILSLRKLEADLSQQGHSNGSISVCRFSWLQESWKVQQFHVSNDKDAIRSILIKIATRLRVAKKEIVYYRQNHSSLLEDLTGTDDSPPSHDIKMPSESVDKSEETANLSNLSDELVQKAHFGGSSKMMLVMTVIEHREGLNVTGRVSLPK